MTLHFDNFPETLNCVLDDCQNAKSFRKNIAIEWSVFGLFLVISEVGSLDYIVELASLSVLSDFHASNPLVCHRFA